MNNDLDHVKRALGDHYRVERELGEGGMATVYLAEDLKHNRLVAVKVLRPELAAMLGEVRFLREIEIAAQLSHPHILSLHDSGKADGLLYYVMPFVDGGSLRERLNASGRPSVQEAVSIVYAVAGALAYAHARDLVHRDIKPENILFQADHPVVSDFGIARALGAAGAANVTEAGLAIGTPAYLSPEQAVGDAGLDHRSDLYALGVLAYELLAGEPPFVSLSAQQTIAAHVTAIPRHVSEIRASVPQQVAEVVMRCLEKDPARRPQSAAEVMAVLRTVSGLELAASTQADARATAGSALLRALVFYAIGFVAVGAIAWGAMMGFGLPDWVFPGALLVMAAGLPAIFLTAWVHYRSQRTATQLTAARTPPLQRRVAARLRPFATWRLTAIATSAAIGLFALAVSGFMTLRAAGIGPAATLLTSGTLAENERLLIADFDVRGADSALGPLMTTMVRSALEQSDAVLVMSELAVAAALRRMQRAPSQQIDLELAREIATREGLTAIVHGEVASVSGEYLLTLRLLEASSGRTLAGYTEAARETRDLVTAVDRLSRRLRSKIGESLRDIRATPALEKVTTPSLEALEKYTAAYRAHYSAADFARSVQLLQEAVALDTAFAMAWRLLAVSAGSGGIGGAATRRAANDAAFRHQDRATPVERDLIAAQHYQAVGRDAERAARALESIVQRDPDNVPAMLALSNIYANRQQYDDSRKLLERILERDPDHVVATGNLALNLFAAGRHADAERMIVQARRRFPDAHALRLRAADLYWFRGDMDGYEIALDSLRAENHFSLRRYGAMQKAAVATMRGRLREGRRLREEERRVEGPRPDNAPPAEVMVATMEAAVANFMLRDSAAAQGYLDATRSLQQRAPAGVVPMGYIVGYASAGRPETARGILSRAVERMDTADRRVAQRDVEEATGWIALGERRYSEAINHFRRSARSADGSVACTGGCMEIAVALSYDGAGQSDSAAMMLEEFVSAGAVSFPGFQALFRGRAYERLAQLYDAGGNPGRAAHYYGRFVNLWSRADPELQPSVERARARLAVLNGGRGVGP